MRTARSLVDLALVPREESYASWSVESRTWRYSKEYKEARKIGDKYAALSGRSDGSLCGE